MRKAGFCRGGSSEQPLDGVQPPGLQVWGPVRPLSRCRGSLRNPARSSPLRTASRGSQCTGYCLGETTCDTEQVVRRPVDFSPLGIMAPPISTVTLHVISCAAQAASRRLMGHGVASAQPLLTAPRWVGLCLPRPIPVAAGCLTASATQPPPGPAPSGPPSASPPAAPSPGLPDLGASTGQVRDQGDRQR